MATTVPVTMDTLITIKISIQGTNKKFKLPMRDLGANVLPAKLRQLLNIPPTQEVIFERFSDSAGAYITLDAENPQVYKTLFRAAKAKLKLRLRATVVSDKDEEASPAPAVPQASNQTPAPIPLPLRTAPVVPPPPQYQTKPQAATQPSPVNTGTIPLHPYARHPAFLKTNMRPSMSPYSVKPPDAEKPVDTEEEAPVPRTFTSFKEAGNSGNSSRENLIIGLPKRDREPRKLREKYSPAPEPMCSWSVYCNACDKPMANEHFHCSVCDGGDYDLCEGCVTAGHHCPGEGHWLIKRFVKSGKVINSTTERIGPKTKPEPEKEMPGAFADEKKTDEYDDSEQPTRTCNCCVQVLPEDNFVTCVDCDDYDLCMSCHVGTQHGHHPGHAFKPATAEAAMGPLASYLCAPGRNVRHAAVCDGCDQYIYGVRHKCLNCPDWDFCSECVKEADVKHPTHRFVPIYEPLPEPRMSVVRHFGIYCDGPLCNDRMDQSYIEGVRYKCAICDDTDFCANCESHPSNRHNRTHPVIKFKTPVRKVSVTTVGEDKQGSPMPSLGDVKRANSTVAESKPSTPTNTASQVRTIVDVKPIEDLSTKSLKEKIQIKDLLAEPINEKTKVMDLFTPSAPAKVHYSELNAHFVSDEICDGTKVAAGERFQQCWILRNPGPHAWPAGCSVRYVGGDNMLNVNNEHPFSATDIAEATESNVIGHPVEVGMEVCFNVRMKAPAREGVAISYWRLKAADGTPFGHRLWCHVEVTKPKAPSGNYEEYVRQLKMLEERQKHSMAIQKFSERVSDLRRSIGETQSDMKAELLATARQSTESRVQLLENLREHMKQMTTLATIPKPPKPTVEDASDNESSGVTIKKQPEIEEAEEPKEANTINETKEADKADNIKEEPAAESSQMVFPVLEKESPQSSTHEAITAPTSEGTKTESVTAPSVSAPSVNDELEIFEDADTVDLLSESEDGFFTDEEYDVLDASDEEFAH